MNLVNCLIKIENELRDEDFSEIDHLSVNLEEEEERFNVLSSEIEALNSYFEEEKN